MTLSLTVARLLLCLVFLVSGSAKLFDLAGSRRALTDFGLPGSLAGFFGLALPAAELAVAAALLPVASARYGAVGALTLLALFLVGISVNLAHGRTPDCHCFGQMHSEPIGWPTLARNAVLASIAGFVVWGGQTNPGASAVAWVGKLTVIQQTELALALAGLILLAIEAWLLFQMLRQQGRILLRLDALEAKVTTGGEGQVPQGLASPPAGLPVGTPAPSFRLDGLRGETLTSEALRAADKPLLLLFTSPNCGPCQSLMPDIGRWQREYAATLNIAVIGEGTADDNRNKAAEHGLTQVLLQSSREVAESYLAYGTPAAVVVRPDGMIGSALALGADAIRNLVAQTLGMATPGPLPAFHGNANGQNGAAGNTAIPLAVKQGQLAPPFTFNDLDGNAISLKSLRGSKTMLLFWNPGCGFCQGMLDDLQAWERNPPPGAPKLLVISSGTAEANREMGLRSPVVLDEGFKAGNAFGANGTPMAVMLDAKGRVASDVAAGAPAVLQLAGVPASAQAL